MSKTAARRVALLASSSLGLAAIASAASLGLALTPTVALAANECMPIGVDPSANGPAADSYECSATPYATGITYDSDGDLTVTKTNTNTTTVTANGVNLTGNGPDSVTWNSSAGSVSGGSGTNGPVIDVTTELGDINITTASVFGSSASVTHGVRATSTGGGDISITRTSGSMSITGTGSQAALEAVTNGGDINMSLTGTTSGRLRAIVAETSGSGDVTLNIAGSVSVHSTFGVAAIDSTAGTGSTTINISGGTLSGGAGSAIRASSASTVDIDNTGSTISGSVDLSGVSGDVTFTNSGTGLWRATGDSVFGAGNDTLNFSSIAPANLGGNVLAEESSIDFGAGNDTLNIISSFEIGSPGHFGTQFGGSLGLGATLAFGAGTDAINNSGAFAIDGPISVTGLEAFNNSGTLYLGPINPQFVDAVFGDLGAHDVLTMPGATFTGLDNSRLIAAVNFESTGQESCAAPTGAGDCLYLPGGATAGSTLVTLINAGDEATLGGFDTAGVTIVDVNGGTSAAEHFTLDPVSAGYVIDPTYGGVIGRPGLFVYALRYDPDTQRHAVVGLPRSEAFEYAMLSGAAQSIWHMTAETVTDRQTDLRGAPEGGALWMRTTGEYTKRDVANSISSFGDTFAFDQSYKLYAGTIIGGLDLIQGRSGNLDYVVGAQIGYVGSSFDLDNSPSSGQFSGATGGLYGSIWSPGVFLDATFNLNGLTLNYDSPRLGSKTNTYTTAFGARLEGGLRYPLSEVLLIEPLATLAFVRTGFEEISLSGGEIRPDDAQSRRAALGLRVGGDVDGQTVNWSYYLTGRAWNEFDGEARGVVNNPGADLPFVDEFSGGFGEAEAGLSLYNDANTLSGFLASGVKFKDGYSAVNLSLGIRMAW